MEVLYSLFIYSCSTLLEMWNFRIILLFNSHGIYMSPVTMSLNVLWGETVTPNFVLTIPPIGTNFVKRIRGGFSIDKIALIWSFAFHFILPLFKLQL